MPTISYKTSIFPLSDDVCGIYFQKFKGLNIKYSYRDPPKALPYPERRLLMYFRQHPFRGVDCSLIEEHKTTSHIKRHGKITYLRQWRRSVCHIWGDMSEAQRAEDRGPKSREQGWSSWGGGSQPPPHQLGDLGERWKLPPVGSAAKPRPPNNFAAFNWQGRPLLTLNGLNFACVRLSILLVFVKC